MTARPVRLTMVANELEARLVCDALRSAGVRCKHDLDLARELLAAGELEGALAFL